MKSVLTLALGLFTLSLAATQLTLQEALDRKLVRVEVSPADMEGWVTHHGKCMTLTLRNLSRGEVRVEILPGQFLEPLDTATQQMVITHREVIALRPGAWQERNIYAMCAEQSDASPSSEDEFVLGLMAEEEVQRIAYYINSHNWQDGTGQHAMWVVTDDASLEGITGDNVDAINALRREVADIKNLEYIAYEPQPDEDYINGLSSLSGNFSYNVPRQCRASLTLEDASGSLVATFFRDKPFEPGSHQFRFSAVELSLSRGTYVVKLSLDGRMAARYEMTIR